MGQYCKYGHDTKVNGRTSDGICRECRRQYSKRWHATHRLHDNIKMKEWREKNKERHDEGTKLWRQRNVERYREIRNDAKLRRLVRMRGNDTRSYRRSEIYRRDGYICQLCLLTVDVNLRFPHQMSATIHHVVEICQGGADTPENVCLAHLGCNQHRPTIGLKLPRLLTL